MMGSMSDEPSTRAVQRRSTARIGADNAAFTLLVLGDDVVRRPLVDIAGNGIGVLLDENDRLESGTQIERLRFVLPIGAPLLSTAIVRHVRQTPEGLVAGLDLVGLPAADQRRLEAWVRGQSGYRAKERRSFSAAGPVSVQFATPDGRVRERPVMLLHPDGCEVGLERSDVDICEGAGLGQLVVQIDGSIVLNTPGEVRELLSHRGRPLRALVAFTALDAAARRRLSRLLAAAGAAAAR